MNKLELKNMLLLFSHKLTDSQTKNAIDRWDVGNFIPLPQELQDVWSNISPDIESLHDTLQPIKEFVRKNLHEGDIALIQGDFGASYIMVNFVKELRIKPLYATTKREIQEFEQDGKTIKKSTFEFRRFREYGQ